MVGFPDPRTLAALEAHRKRQDEFRAQFGPDYRARLDLIFANPDGTPLKPDSISATVSALVQAVEDPEAEGGRVASAAAHPGSHMLADGVPLAVVPHGWDIVRTDAADISVHAASTARTTKRLLNGNNTSLTTRNRPQSRGEPEDDSSMKTFG